MIFINLVYTLELLSIFMPTTFCDMYLHGKTILLKVPKIYLYKKLFI